MSTTKSIWATLSAIDCSAHVEKKGGFDYLAWTWAWAMVKEHYPLASYSLLEDTTYPDKTMEVRVEVTVPLDIVEDKPLTHIMWLPVLDHRNKPIANPSAFDINSARMRCLVKCLAFFGLGHYIYAGESAPQERPIVETPEMVQAGEEINRCLDNDDYHGAAQLWIEWEYEEIQIIARAPSKGGQLSTANRKKIQSTEFRMALNEAKGITNE